MRRPILLINGNTITEHIQIKASREHIVKREMNRVDNLLNHLKKHKHLYRKLVIIIAMMFLSGFANPDIILAVDVGTAITKIDTLGKQLLRLVQSIGYWATLILTSKDMLKDLLSGDRKSIGNTVAKGIMIMATIYFLPELFDMMKSLIED